VVSRRREQETRGYITILNEGERPAFDWMKKGKQCQDIWYWLLFKMFTSQIEATVGGSD
jgi:hypothetical protein